MLKRIPVFWQLSAAFVVIIVLVLTALDYVISGGGGSINDYGQDLLMMLAIVIAVGLGCASTWLIVNRSVNRPVSKLVEGMNKLAEKDFGFRMEEDDRDQFGALASSFNDMASMLSSSMTELKKNQDYLWSILESSADFIITVNPSGTIQTFNKGAEDALGYDRFEVIGKPMEMFFADPQQRQVALARLGTSDSVANFETQFVTRNGDLRDVLLTLSRLRNSEGEVIGTIGISKDITREKRLQSEIIQSQRFVAIGQVFTGIQHSMKNMLNAAKGGAYMVRTGLAKDNRKMLEEGWEMVQESISRMTDMSMSMLKYVKEFRPELKQVKLSDMLSDINQVIGQTASDKGVKFRLNVSPDMPAVVCDGGMIHSVVMDVASNALDACLLKEYDESETPEVTMSARLSGDKQDAIIEISDNGCGMTAEVRTNIFTPFFSTKNKTGTGLGLSIASRMISVHHGKIDVESEPDRGTVFRIVIPIDGTD
jgi:PAS domain S-box-containing protein